jgi:hypothetical protein
VVHFVLPQANAQGFQLASPFPSWPHRGLPVFDGGKYSLLFLSLCIVLPLMQCVWDTVCGPVTSTILTTWCQYLQLTTFCGQILHGITWMDSLLPCLSKMLQGWMNYVQGLSTRVIKIIRNPQQLRFFLLCPKHRAPYFEGGN